MKELPEYLIKAYELFKEEYSKHLAYFRQQIEHPEQVDAQREEIYRRFHTIKGGAGFLELENIVALATEGEEIFRPQSYKASKISRFKEIVDLLEKESEFKQISFTG